MEGDAHVADLRGGHIRGVHHIHQVGAAQGQEAFLIGFEEPVLEGVSRREALSPIVKHTHTHTLKYLIQAMIEKL